MTKLKKLFMQHSRLNRSRRLSEDYETLTPSSEAWIKLAIINIMVRRLA
jgi:transposase